MHPGKKNPAAAALYYSYSRQMGLQNYEFEKEEEDGETEKIKTLFQSSSLQDKLSVHDLCVQPTNNRLSK